jgi:16S rRNA processing protein RimM
LKQEDGTRAEWVAVGKIVRPVGIRGEVKAILLTDDERRFERSRNVRVGADEGTAVARQVEQVRYLSDAWRMKFVGIESMDDAETLRDAFIFLPRTKERTKRPDAFPIDDVVGCEMWTTAGRRIGEVVDVLELPANDVWVVRDGAKEYLVPAVRALIPRVDIEAKRIEVVDLEGLFE